MIAAASANELSSVPTLAASEDATRTAYVSAGAFGGVSRVVPDAWAGLSRIGRGLRGRLRVGRDRSDRGGLGQGGERVARVRSLGGQFGPTGLIGLDVGQQV